MIRSILIILIILAIPVDRISAQYRYSYLEMGRRELINNNYNNAILYFNKYIETVPSRFEGYYLRGITKYYLDDLAGAESDFSKAISRLPEFPELYVLRAVVRSEKLDYDEALKDFHMAISLDSTYVNAYYYRALTYFNLHNYDKALDDCNKVLKLDKDYQNLYIILGVTLSRLGKYDEAITDLCYSIEKDKSNPVAYVERGSAYMEVDKTELAMQDFQRALEIDSLNTYALFQRGLAWMKLQDYPKALDDFNKVLKLSPDNQLAYFNRALINSNANEDQRALNDLLNILRQNPNNMLVYYNLGITFLRMKNYSDAIKSFDQAIALYPDYTEAYYARSRAKQATGDMAGAIDDNRRAEAIAKKNQEKSDTTKYEEGLKIMKLTHLSADFTETKDKEGKPQYEKGDIRLKSFYGLVFDPVDGDPIVAYDSKGKKYYRTKTVSLRSIKADSISARAFLKIQEADSLLAKAPQGVSFYLKRGVFYTRTMQYAKALADMDTAQARDPENILVYFSRANLRLAMLDNYFSDSVATDIIARDKRDWIQTTYSRILIDYNTVISLDPDFFYARYNRAYARFLMQDYEGSLSDYEKIRVQTKFPEATFNAGLLNILLGNREEGCNDLSVAGAAGITDSYRIIRKYCN